MRYTVEHNNQDQSLTIRELGIVVNTGDVRKNIKQLRQLVPMPAVLVYPFLGQRHQADWDEIKKETLTEPRIGQESFVEIITADKLDGFSEFEFEAEMEIPEPIEGFGK